MAKRRVKAVLLLTSCLLAAGFARAQTGNLLKNPNADEGLQHWQASGRATVEDSTGSFVLRDGGRLLQVVVLPDDSVGQYAVLIGRASSERVNADGAITGLPYLYGHMTGADGVRIYAHLQGRGMLSSAKAEGEWVYLWGIFEVPPGTKKISFSLNQAQARGVPHNGSAARFDDLGLYLFTNEQEARGFVTTTTMINAGPDSAAGRGATGQRQCSLGLAQAPGLYGFRLGMTLEETLDLFPESRKDAGVRRALERAAGSPQNGGRILLVLDPHKQGARSEFAGVKAFKLAALDGRIYSMHVEFDGPRWESVSDFVQRHAGEMNLPPPDEWVQAASGALKYLICDGFEVRFYAAPRGSANANYIDIVDNVAEKALLRP